MPGAATIGRRSGPLFRRFTLHTTTQMVLENSSQTMNLFPVNQGAAVSACGQYRYSLWRIWDKAKPLILFIGLNPSTADADRDDPTIRRCKGFASALGYGGFYMGNLFAYRATKPADMKACPNPVGRYTDEWLKTADSLCQMVIFVWGTQGSHLGRDKEVIGLFPNAYCLGQNEDGSPKHPLYLHKRTVPYLFRRS